MPTPFTAQRLFDCVTMTERAEQDVLANGGMFQEPKEIAAVSQGSHDFPPDHDAAWSKKNLLSLGKCEAKLWKAPH